MTRIMMFALLWIACASGANAQTLVLGMPLDKHVNALKVYGDTLFAACDEGLYSFDMKKSDGWKSYAFDGVKIIDFVKSGSRVLAIGWEEREYEDPDMIWYLDPFGTMLLEADGMGCASRDVTPGWVAESGEGCFFSLAQDAVTPDRIYMSCTPTKAGEYPNEFYAVFSSEDFGGQWTVATLTLAGGAKMEQQVLAGPPCLHVNKSSGRVHVYGAPAVDCLCHYLYVSDDHLGSLQMIIDMYWFYDEFSAEEYERPSMHTQVVPSPHDGEEYLLKTKGYGVWKSTGGKSWNLVTERFLVDGVFYDEETPGIAYYVKHLQRDDKTWMQLYRSSDGGETWVLWQEEEGINPISIMMHQGALYFQNALTGEVCQWPLKENVQRETALVKEGKRWEYVRGDVAPVFHYVYTLQGDTTICGKAYKKMYMSKDKGEPEYVSAMREEDGKVFKVSKGSEEERLLFDFNAEVGDVVYHRADDIVEMYLTVKDIDHVLVGDREQKRFVLTMTEILNNGTDRLEYPDDVIWVEGIGSIVLFDSPESVFGSGGGGWLLSCYEDDRMVFANEDFYPGQEISYEPLTIDDAQNTFGMTTCQLALAGSKVESCEDDCLVVADVNSGNKVRLFGMGCDFAEGTQLGGSIAGLLGEWNDMMTLFPTRFTDVSTILSDADGIHDVVNGEDIHGESLYDLQGRSVGNGISHLKKGIYIIEGRKIVVR